MKILISCVGIRDPYNDNEKKDNGPILSFIEYLNKFESLSQYKPDRIYLLPTANRPNSKRPTEDNGHKTSKVLSTNYEVYVRPINVSDPTDYNELIGEMKRIIKDIKQEEPLETDIKYFVNVSPGTSQMEAVWLSFVNTGILKATLLQVKAPHDEPNEEKRVRVVSETPIFESEMVRLVKELFSHYSFREAKEAFDELALKTYSNNKIDIAHCYCNLSEAYMFWEGFKYENAFNKIITSLNNPYFKKSDYFILRNLVEKQKQTLEKLNIPEMSETVTDIYHSAKRKIKSKDYVEAIWRFMTSYEMAVIYLAEELLRTYLNLTGTISDWRACLGTYTSDPVMSKLFKKLGSISRVRSHLNYSLAEDILEQLSNILLAEGKTDYDFYGSISAIIKSNETNINRLASKRNKTMHDLTPPTEQDCIDAEKIISNFLSSIFSITNINDYPFSTEALECVEKELAKLLSH